MRVEPALPPQRPEALSKIERRPPAGPGPIVLRPEAPTPTNSIGAPGEVVEAVGTVESGGAALRVPAAELAGLRPTLHRISVRTAPHLYTSYVLLGITP